MTRATTPAIGLALLVAALAACDGKSNNGSAEVPDGGVCGNYPLCVATLMEPCVASGTCTLANAGDGRVLTFANGVVQDTITDPVNQRSTARVTTTDGTTTCFTVETTVAGGNPVLAWRNAAGATVATGVLNETANYVDVTCAGGGTARVTDVGDCFGRAYVCTAAP